jgi:CheY-like chemotaxis protein
MPAEREKRILVVDDDDAIRTLLFTLLRRRGFEVDVARGGREAIARCVACSYSLILLDLMMPHVTGWDVLAALRENEKDMRPLPLVIAMTAGLDPHDLDPTLVAGVVRKPFDVEVLMDVVAGCWSTLTAEAQIEGCPPADSRSRVRPIDGAN